MIVRLSDTLAWDSGVVGLTRVLPASPCHGALGGALPCLASASPSVQEGMWTRADQFPSSSITGTPPEGGPIPGPSVFPEFKLLEPGLVEFPPLPWTLHGFSPEEGCGSQADGPGVPALPPLHAPPWAAVAP